MGAYIGTLLAVLSVLFLYKCRAIKKVTAAVWTAAILILVAGLRYNVGTDYRQYVLNYSLYKLIGFSDFSKIGLHVISFLAEHIYDDSATWFFLMSLLTVGLSMAAVYRYSETWAASVILYIFIGGWAASFNIVKQSAAIAILIFSQNYLIERKFKKWALVCVLATMFHVSALLMIPIYFLLQMKFSWKSVLLICSAGFVLYLSYDRLFAVIGFLKQGENTAAIDSAVGGRQVNLLRVLVGIAPAVMLLALHHYYEPGDDKKMTVWANAIVFSGMLACVTAKSVYLTRFLGYLSIYHVYFLPHLISKLKLRENRMIILSVCMVLYCIFWLYDLSKGSTTQTFHWIFERGT